MAVTLYQMFYLHALVNERSLCLLLCCWAQLVKHRPDLENATLLVSDLYDIRIDINH